MPMQHPNPLITTEALAALLDSPHQPVVLDARWSLQGPPGRERYAQAHLPGAAYLDLDTDLSDPEGPGTGRHPLPDPERFQAAMRAAGVRADRPVVAYDSPDPISGAARAWWLLRYFGHPDVRVLDGGFAAWQAAGLPVTAAVQRPDPGDWQAQPGKLPLLVAGHIPGMARNHVLLDFRAPERYSGEVEPLDPVGGHIPGAGNLPASQTLTTGGHQLPPDELRARFASFGIGENTLVGAYCGSGVAASQGILALQIAGLDGALYVGSWSEWVSDPSRPVATGPEPGEYPPRTPDEGD
jgi:thiosulfate/3-mercaptopyruvate sulfurtransferase